MKFKNAEPHPHRTHKSLRPHPRGLHGPIINPMQGQSTNNITFFPFKECQMQKKKFEERRPADTLYTYAPSENDKDL